MDYQSIINPSPAVRESVKLCCGSNCYTWPKVVYDAPSGTTRSYDDTVVENSWAHTFGGMGDRRTSRTFKRLKRQGEIIMDNYATGKTTTRNYLVQADYEFGHWADYYRTSGGSCCHPGWTWFGIASHTKQDDLESLHDVQVVDRRLINDGDFIDSLSREVREAKLQAYNQGITGYDLLTEIAESGKTLEFLTGLLGEGADALDSFKKENLVGWARHRKVNSRTLFRHGERQATRWANRWLKYQYALLPIILSINAIREEGRNSKYRYDSERAFRSISDESDTSGNLPSECIVIEDKIDVEIRALSKARYLPNAVHRLFSRTGLNPAVTAWELIPYSFVADWFTNIGDQIQALTGYDFSYQRGNCYSVKRVKRTQWRYVNDTSDLTTRVWPGNICRPAYTASHLHTRAIDQVVREVVEETYHRYVFDKPEFGIEFNGFQHWKHVVSGAALAWKPIQKILNRVI